MRNVSGTFKRSNSRRLALGLAALLAGVLMAGSSLAGPSDAEQIFINQGWLKTDTSGNPIKTSPPNVDSVIDDPVGGTGLVVPAEFWERVGAAAIRTMNESDSVVDELAPYGVDPFVGPSGGGANPFPDRADAHEGSQSHQSLSDMMAAAYERQEKIDEARDNTYGFTVLGALYGGELIANLFAGGQDRYRDPPVGGDPEVGTPMNNDVILEAAGGTNATPPTPMPPVEPPPMKMEKAMEAAVPLVGLAVAGATAAVVFVCALDAALYVTSGAACAAK